MYELSFADAVADPAMFTALWAANGFVVVTGIEDLAAVFDASIERLAGIDAATVDAFIADSSALDIDTCRRLARMSTDAQLIDALLGILRPLLLASVGPAVQVSTDFQGQFKTGNGAAVTTSSYDKGSDYQEVYGRYLLHQDVCGARRATSPSGMTIWTPLRDSDHWPLLVFPETHRQGLLCRRWLDPRDKRLAALGEPVEITARRGTVLLFHGMLLHGTGAAGPSSRVSCDMRVFPITPFLPSPFDLLVADPVAELVRRLDAATDDVTAAALMEALVVLDPTFQPDVSPGRSPRSWAGYTAALTRGDLDASRFISAMVNTEFSADPVESYVAQFDEPLRTHELEVR